MTFRVLSIILLSLTSVASFAQTSIAFYNVENLYDTINQPHDDDEFLPEAKSQWNSEKYGTKLTRINQVMDSLGSPILMGFAEIENGRVLEDVIATSKTRTNYKVVHYESTDLRGIDVGLIYNPEKLALSNSGYIRFTLDNPEHPYTRDILWSKFVVGKDTLFALVNHWPSRRGGAEESEKNRIKAASFARKFIDSVQRASPKSLIIFMGDLNDYPTNASAKLIAAKLTPMITSESGKFGGSYLYQGEWDILDHILVSENFFKNKSMKLVKNSGSILSSDFILTEYKGNIVPKRNYAGGNYLDGYSDHLPVRVLIELK